MRNLLDSYLNAYNGDITFDFDNNILLNWYPKRIVELNPNRGLSLLELGLGHGYSTNIFSDFYKNHTVLDGSPAVIELFKSKYPNSPVKIIETFFEEFEINQKYDMIVMGFILEHVKNPVEILRHFKQFLKPNGVIYAAVPNAAVMNRRLGIIAGYLNSINDLSENDHLLGHLRYYTLKSFREDIDEAGYELHEMEGIYLKPLASFQMQSLELSDEMIRALCVLGIEYPELSCGLMAKFS